MVRTKPINLTIPEATKITLSDGTLRIEGPKGNLSQAITNDVAVKIGDGMVSVEAANNDKRAKAMQGLVIALLRNAMLGVNEEFVKTLELSGVGFRAQVTGDELVLSVGFSHQVKLKAPQGITFSVLDNKIKVVGIDKHMVGQTAHTIRSVRPPEPYKGKGIKYEGERIRRKPGKAAAKAVGGKA